MVPRSTALALCVLLLCSLAATAGPVVAAQQDPSGVADAAHASGSPPAATTAQDALVAECAATPPADFAPPEAGNATIGWFDGYWYDEPLEIDAEGGISRAELDALAARTAARFEALRCLTYDELPSVEVLTREEFAAENAEAFADVEADARLFDNAKLETLLLVGETDDSIDVREADRTATVAGYYDFLEDRIVVVSNDPETLRIDEHTLAHELGHALQDQHFDLERYDRNTTDRNAGTLGLIEGDVHRIERQYLERCEAGRWSEPCVVDDAGEGEGGQQAGEPANWGLYFTSFQPYSDGPGFAEFVYQEGGYDALNAVYDDPPETAFHTIYPETYGEVEIDPDDLVVPDESDDDWERLTDHGSTVGAEEDEELPEGSAETPDYDVIGQAGLTAMLVDPAYDDPPRQIVERNDFLNRVGFTGIDERDPFDYDQPETDGWRGDKLYVYATDDPADGADRETATVWKLAWTNATESAAFLEAYESLLEIRGAERVDGYAHTYEFSADSAFDGAVTLSPADDRLWIVTAPTVDDLTAVHDVRLLPAGEAVEAPADEEAGDDASSGDADATDDDSASGDVTPGFGPAVALAALVLAALAAVRDR